MCQCKQFKVCLKPFTCVGCETASPKISLSWDKKLRDTEVVQHCWTPLSSCRDFRENTGRPQPTSPFGKTLSIRCPASRLAGCLAVCWVLVSGSSKGHLPRGLLQDQGVSSQYLPVPQLLHTGRKTFQPVCKVLQKLQLGSS